MIIGLAGGVGAGKSTIVKMLEEHFHAKAIVADELGHMALEPGSPVNPQIAQNFGERFLLSDGNVDRELLAVEIYADDEKRERLNQIIHPFVFQEIKRRLREWEREPLIVIETAIMFETGCDGLCDEVWGVSVEKETRIKRLMASRGYSREKAETIMDKQLSDAQLRERCDRILDNNGDEKKILQQLQDFLFMEEKL